MDPLSVPDSWRGLPNVARLTAAREEQRDGWAELRYGSAVRAAGPLNPSTLGGSTLGSGGLNAMLVMGPGMVARADASRRRQVLEPLACPALFCDGKCGRLHLATAPVELDPESARLAAIDEAMEADKARLRADPKARAQRRKEYRAAGLSAAQARELVDDWTEGVF